MMAESTKPESKQVSEMDTKEDLPSISKQDIHSHIPTAVFVEDVDKFMQDPNNSSAEVVLRRFDEQHSKYKFLETNLNEKKKRLRRTLPDLQKSLNMIEFLKTKKTDSKLQYLLASGVYAQAEVCPTEKVFLWLGANVMLEYPIDEASDILTKNLGNATKSLEQLDKEIDYILDQCTTLEVAMTRVYNWDVKERRDKKQQQQLTS